MKIEKAAESTINKNQVLILYKGTNHWFLSEWQKDFLGNYHRVKNLRKAKSRKSVEHGFITAIEFGTYKETRPESIRGRFWNIEQFQ